MNSVQVPIPNWEVRLPRSFWKIFTSDNLLTITTHYANLKLLADEQPAMMNANTV